MREGLFDRLFCMASPGEVGLLALVEEYWRCCSICDAGLDDDFDLLSCMAWPGKVGLLALTEEHWRCSPVCDAGSADDCMTCSE